MGAIADLMRQKDQSPFIGRGDGARHWRQVFGANKESGGLRQAQTNTFDRGSYVRSAVDDAAIKRLLQAYRSRAPGNWTDDRYEQSKHFVGIQYVCIHRAATQLQQAEFRVKVRDGSDPKDWADAPTDHPLVQILEKPNREDSFGDLMYSFYQQISLTGLSLCWMVPSMLPSAIEGKGTPMELYPIETALAIPQPVINPDYPDGYWRIQPLYPYGPFSSFPTPSTAVGAAIPAQWMMRLKFKHPLLRYDGWSPQTALRLHLDEVESMDRSRWYSMKRSVNPSAVLQFDDMEGMQPLNAAEVDRIHAEWESEFQGDVNAGKLIVGLPGGKLEQWGSRPIDMDYPQGWDQLTSFCMSGFGMSKAAAFMADDSSYATLFATLKQLHLMTLQPFCDQVAAKLTRELAPFYGDNLVVQIRCKRIDDHELVDKQLSMAMQAKAITKNEIRAKLSELDLEPTDEDWGKEIAGTDSQQQQGMMPGGMPGMPGAAPVQDPNALPPLQEPALPTDSLDIFGMGGDIQEPELPDEENRPDTGTLGEGSLGPRKSAHRLRRRVELVRRAKALLPVETQRLSLMNGKFRDFLDEALNNGHD